MIQCNFSFDGDNYESTGSSKYAHGYTLGLGNYQDQGSNLSSITIRESLIRWNPVKGKALTTGCVGSECALKTELMDMTSLQWSDGPDYPFTSE